MGRTAHLPDESVTDDGTQHQARTDMVPPPEWLPDVLPDGRFNERGMPIRIAALRASMSWRITAPLREALRILRPRS